MHLLEMAQIHHAIVESKGWHNKLPLEYLALIASEVGEAVNECRGHEPTEKLGEELADIILRTIDFAHELGINIEFCCMEKIEKNKKNLNLNGRIK